MTFKGSTRPTRQEAAGTLSPALEYADGAGCDRSPLSGVDDAGEETLFLLGTDERGRFYGPMM